MRSSDHQRAVTPVVTRRQRVPFDWTVQSGSAGHTVCTDDKTLEDRVAEMRAQYRATRTDRASGGGAAMVPEGVDPSMACVVS
mmetsp:Transcript_21179/g.54229  ORF Transcript_21179/g.54229 Transcript_21179/m.54229 type:complete len:83 (+) Transcript_21179:2-250(+)